MSRFTAEDFAQATLATRDRRGVARRTDPRDTHQWYAYGGEPGWFSDEEMAAAAAERARRKLFGVYAGAGVKAPGGDES